MNVIDRLLEKLELMEKAINPTIQDSINKNKGTIIDYQSRSQWYDTGEDSQGKDIQPSYALSTRVTKRRKGQKISNVTLKDTGDLERSIKVDAKVNEMIISANVEYFKYLVNHYSDNILLGIQPKYLKEFTIKKVLPNLATEYKAIIKK